MPFALPFTRRPRDGDRSGLHAPLRSCEPRPFPPFRVGVSLKRIGFAPTMPSADFYAAIGPPRGRPSPDSGTRRRSPRLSLTTFVARPPDLQRRPLMDGGLCCLWSTRPTGTAYYPISVRRAAILLDASFRRRVTETPLRFANPSPPSSWIRDLHPPVVKHAWHTTKPLRGSLC